MRVTKTIREYIEKEVKIRLDPKYEAERKEAERQTKAKNEFLEGCQAAAEAAFDAYFEAHFSEISDFCEDKRGDKHCYNDLCYRAVEITDRMYSTSVHNWESRRRAEAKAKVEEIIVELELGGTKAELMAMLEKI